MGEAKSNPSRSAKAGQSLRMQFAVADTGIGIPPEKIGELFQPFVQADASLTRRHGGTGLGLAISKRLAKALGGDIEVASELGKGSTFTLAIDVGPLEGVRLLRVPQPPSAAQNQRPTDQQDLALKGRVLLAEDVADVHRVLTRILRNMRLEVDVACDGRAACNLAQQSKAEGRPYDLILMDIQMPILDGYQATQWLRQHGWQGPVVAVTARATVEDREKCLAAGCDDYLAKPITADGLRDMLAQYLERIPKSGARASCPHLAAETAALPTEPPGLLEGGLLDAAKVAALLQTFRGELPARLSGIEAAWSHRDLHRLQEAAHDLKGTAGIFGFTHVSAAAAVIDQRATAAEDLQQLEAAVAESVELCQQIVGQAFQPDENQHKSGWKA